MMDTAKRYILIWMLLLLALAPSALMAQRSSTVYSEERVAVEESEYDKMYHMLLSDKERIYTLLKFNAVDWGQLKPSLIVEQNIGKSFNIEPRLRLKAFDWSFENGIQYAFEGGVDFKYYYNYKRRNRLGKKTNGFSGNYLSLGGAGTISDYSKYMETQMLKHNISFTSPLTASIYHVWTADLMYGVQRRIGAIGYVDVKAGFRYINYVNYGENLIPVLQVGIGFGLTKDKALDIIR